MAPSWWKWARAIVRQCRSFSGWPEPSGLTASTCTVTFAKIRRCSLYDRSQVASIDYRAPADAAAASLEPGGAHLHFSNNVLEHVPASVIVDILREGARLLSPDGIAYHRVNPADLFLRAGHHIVDWIETEDSAAVRTIRSGFPLDPAFAEYTPEQLGVTMFEVESRPPAPPKQ
jgi:hypothetical protein